jgi:hypothetical protein
MSDIQNKEKLTEFLLKKKSGAFISVHSFKVTDEENNILFDDLVKKISSPNVGLRRLFLCFEINNIKYLKKILLLNGIDLKKLMNLGIELNRNSVIYFDDLLFLELATNPKIGIGKVLSDFKQKGWNLETDSKDFNERDFLIRLINESCEGLQNEKEVNNLKLVYSYFETYSFNQVAYGGKKPGSEERQIILYEE